MKPITIALIGVSGFGERHYWDIRNLIDKGVVRLIAATVINQEQEQEKCAWLRTAGCEVYKDYRHMLKACEGRVDLCVIPTGIHMHFPMAMAALDAKFHVLLEKPVAGTIQEADELARVAARQERLVAIGYQHLYAPETMEVKKVILSGGLGTVRAIKCMGIWPRSNRYFERNNWAGRLKVGKSWVLDAPFNNALAHWLNLMCFFAGTQVGQSAEVVAVQAELYRSRAIESADTACLRIETASGVPIFFYVTHSAREVIDPILEVCGTDGSMIWSKSDLLFKRDGKVFLSLPITPEMTMREKMYRAVASRIQGGDNFICDLGIARQQTLCASAAFAGTSICEIAPEFLESLEDSMAVKNIERSIERAFVAEKLWSELGEEWAQSSDKISTTDFQQFTGVRKRKRSRWVGASSVG